MLPVLIDLLNSPGIVMHKSGIPIVEYHNDPHFESAIIQKILLQNGEYSQGPLFREFIQQSQRSIGMFSRWPDGSGGQLSQSEMAGIRFMDPVYGSRILYQLKKQLGFYPNDRGTPWYKQFIGRHYWLFSYLDGGLSTTQDLLWSVYCRSIAASSDQGVSEHILVWIMADFMEQYPESKKAITLWRHMRVNRGFTMKRMMEIYFPTIPWFAKYVKEDL